MGKERDDLLASLGIDLDFRKHDDEIYKLIVEKMRKDSTMTAMQEEVLKKILEQSSPDEDDAK